MLGFKFTLNPPKDFVDKPLGGFSVISKRPQNLVCYRKTSVLDDTISVVLECKRIYTVVPIGYGNG